MWLTWKNSDISDVKARIISKQEILRRIGERDLSSQHGGLPFKTGELEHILQYQDIAKNLTNGWFAQNLKNGFNIYEHIPLIKYFTFKKQVIK